MPLDEREYMHDRPTEEIPTERRPRLNRRRLALWIVVLVCLIVGGPLLEVLAWAWAIILFAALVLASSLFTRWWLTGRGW